MQKLISQEDAKRDKEYFSTACLKINERIVKDIVFGDADEIELYFDKNSEDEDTLRITYYIAEWVIKMLSENGWDTSKSRLITNTINFKIKK